MGSYAFTCCVSGLPIEAGDPVRWFLLTQSPYTRVVESHGNWIPRTWPIKAKYNDYGSIEEWEEGPLVDVILKGLQLDLVEQGTGSNTVHDGPTSKGMTFPELLRAVVQDRVLVERYFDLHKDSDSTPERMRSDWIPSYQPTLRKLQALLPDLLVDEVFPGFRVRAKVPWTEDRRQRELEAARMTCEAAGYAALLTAGETNTYAQLLVYTAPGMTDELGTTAPTSRNLWHGPRPEDPLRVRQGMIREDVWRTLLKLKVRTWGKEFTVKDYREAPKKFLANLIELRPKKHSRLDATMLGVGLQDLPGGFYLGRELVPFTVGLQTHARLLDPIPETFAQLMAEFWFLFDFLASTRHLWQPSTSAGPQFGEWKSHREYHAALAGMRRKTNELADP